MAMERSLFFKHMALLLRSQAATGGLETILTRCFSRLKRAAL